MSKHKAVVDINGTEVKIKSEDKEVLAKIETLLKKNEKDLNPKKNETPKTEGEYLKG